MDSAVIRERGKRCSICVRYSNRPPLLRRNRMPAWAMLPRILSTFRLPACVVDNCPHTAKHSSPPESLPESDTDTDPGRTSCGSRDDTTACWCPGVGPACRRGPHPYSSLAFSLFFPPPYWVCLGVLAAGVAPPPRPALARSALTFRLGVFPAPSACPPFLLAACV